MAYTRNKNATKFQQFIPCINGRRFLRKKESKTTTASHRQKKAGKSIKIPEKTENMKEISQVVSQKRSEVLSEWACSMLLAAILYQ